MGASGGTAMLLSEEEGSSSSLSSHSMLAKRFCMLRVELWEDRAMFVLSVELWEDRDGCISIDEL
jgi:hypothetical protein